MHRVLLLNPPSPGPVFRDHYCSSEAKATYLWQPLDLLVQAAVLGGARIPHRCIDAVSERLDLPATLARVRAFAPTAAVVLVSERTWRSDRATLTALRHLGLGTVIASGDFARFGTGPISELAALADFSLTDFTTTELPALLQEAAASPAAAARPGLATFDDVCAGEHRMLGKEPLDYPTLDPRSFDPRRYRLPYPGFRRVASVLATYGCPYPCRYCHVGELGVRLRPVARIVDDFAAARDAGLTRVYVRDATANARPAHLAAWADALVAADLALPWATFATARPFDDALARRVAAAGCRHLQVGIETLDDDLRRANGKPFDTADHRAFVQTCHRHGIQATAHVVLGLVGETAETLAHTADELASVGFDYAAINLAETRAGTPWRTAHQPLAIDPATGEADASSVPLAQLRAAQARAYRSVFLRPERLLEEARERLRERDVTDLFALAGTVAGFARR